MKQTTMPWYVAAVSLVLFFFSGPTFSAEPHASSIATSLRVNQIQVIGTHNSYHIQPHASIMKLVQQASPQQAEAIAYSHRPLPEQFSKLGIRQIELDVYADPMGGHYADPMGPKMVAQSDLPNVPNLDPKGELQKPGLKVLHAPDVDFATTVRTFVGALEQIKAWSDGNPEHLPILVLVEAKQDRVVPIFPKPKPFDAKALDTLDAEILSVFDREHLLTPDDVRGTAKTLREAVLSQGWPTVNELLGKVFFALDNGGEIRDRYLVGHPALRKRILFVDVPPAHAAAAFLKRNDPIRDFEHIQQLVRQGFLVRTRADADTVQARNGDTTRRDKAFASGAQFISTDYPEPNSDWSDYKVRFPNDVIARSNPINGS